MTVCNMSIEAGARAGMIAPDETTFAYLKGRRFTPKGAAWDEAVAEWSKLPTDPGANFDRELVIDAATLVPYVSWGTSPGMVAPITSAVPDPADRRQRTATARAFERALEYMDLKAGTPLEEVAIDRVFIGSCTNGRIEDLRAAARIAAGHKVSSARQRHGRSRLAGGQGAGRSTKASTSIFIEAGFDWREPGCSMCLGMNPDILCSPASAAPPPATATSKAARAAADARISCRPRWPQPPPSPATSSTSATGHVSMRR